MCLVSSCTGKYTAEKTPRHLHAKGGDPIFERDGRACPIRKKQARIRVCFSIATPAIVCRRKGPVQSMALSSGEPIMISRFSVASETAARATTIFPASTECVSHTLPPMMQSFPIRVCPPSTVAPA